MNIKWTKDLEVGVDTIDNEHKKLYEMVNQLLEACNMGNGKKFISEMIEFLVDYTKVHFIDEEKMMQLINYPEYSIQKIQHDAFLKNLNDLKDKFEDEGNSLMVVLQTKSMIILWLNKHILMQDKKLGIYINKYTHKTKQ